MGDDARYDAFISYCHHSADRRSAKWLQRFLEGYRTPRALRRRGVPSRLRRVFRDDDELAASSDLGEGIGAALSASRFLVVICSPRTPHSRWVNEEIDRFTRMGRGREIVTFLIEGEPADAFPPSLLAWPGTSEDASSSAEPLAADARPQEGQSARRRRHHAALKILAAILGVEFDELRQRHQERALRRLALSASAATLGVVLLASLSVLAWTQRQEAIRRLGESLLAQADSQVLLHRVDADDLYADSYDAFTAIGASTGVAELALTKRLLASPPPVGVFAGHQGSVSRVLFAGDGERLVSAGQDGTIRLWDIATQAQSAFWRVSEGAIVDVALLPRAEHAVYATSSGVVAILDLADGRISQELASGRPGLRRLVASHDGRFVAWGGENGLLEVADLVEKTTTPLPSGHGDVTGLCFGPEGPLLMSSSSEHTVQLWDPRGGRAIGAFDYGTMTFEDLAAIPDGRGVVIARSGLNLGAYVWSFALSGNPTLTFVTHGAANPGNDFTRIVRTGAVAVSPETRVIDEGLGLGGEVAIGGEGGHLVVWDPARSDQHAVLIGQAGQITSLAYSADGRYLASSGSDGDIMIWARAALGRLANSLLPYEGFTRSTAISYDGTMAAAGGDAGVVQVWDVSTRRVIRSRAVGEAVVKVAFSPDDRFVVYKGVKSSVLSAWSLLDDRTVRLEGHGDAVTDFLFTSDRRLVSASTDGTLRVWSLETAATERVFRVGRRARVAASLRNRAAIVLVTDAGDVVLYDLSEGREVWSRRFAGARSPRIAVLDDRVIAVSGSRGIILLWDVDSGEERAPLSGHDDEVTALVGVGGQWLLSTSWDHTLRVWDFQSGANVRMIRRETMFGYSMAVAPNEQFVVAAGESPVRIWPLRIAPPWIRYHETLRAARETLKVLPQDAESLRTLGEWSARAGASAMALSLLERAQKGGAAIRWTELAGLYWINGRFDEARSAYDRALAAKEITSSFHRLRTNALSTRVEAR